MTLYFPLWSNIVFNMVQQKMGKSVLVCQLKHDEAKLQQKAGAGPDLVSCLDQAIQENIKFLPDINKLKAAFGISDDSSS